MLGLCISGRPSGKTPTVFNKANIYIGIVGVGARAVTFTFPHAELHFRRCLPLSGAFQNPRSRIRHHALGLRPDNIIIELLFFQHHPSIPHTAIPTVSMSGIEVIGLALGLWPTLIQAVKLYRRERDKNGAGRQEVAISIEVYHRAFEQCLSKLLQGDEHLSDKDRSGLLKSEEPFTPMWLDDEVSARLRMRLGAMLPALLHEVEATSERLKSLRDTFETINGGSVSVLRYEAPLGERAGSGRAELFKIRALTSWIRTTRADHRD
jgi:hypothetical protein